MDEENKQQNNDDIHVEKDADLDDSVVAEESSAETIKKLRTKLKEAEAKATEDQRRRGELAVEQHQRD